MFALRTEHFPFVYGFTWGELTLHDVAKMEHAYTEVHGRNRPFYSVTDTRGLKRPGAVVRREVADLTMRLMPATEELAVTSSVVVHDRLLAGALTALGWMTAKRFQIEYAASTTEATKRAMNVLNAQTGARVPKGAEAFAAAIDSAQADPYRLGQLRTGGRTPPADARP